MPAKRAAPRKARRLTDAMIEKYPLAKKGSRYSIADSTCPGLKLRIGHRDKSFVIWKQIGRNQFWSARHIGKYPALDIAEARNRARSWLALVEQGLDPSVQARREVRARLDRATFAEAAQDFTDQKLPTERRRKEVTHIIMTTLVPLWGDRPLVEITRRDVVELIRGKKLEGKPGTARILLVLVKRMFTWFVGQEVYALDASPCSEIKATALLGETSDRDRVLSDLELRALWIATSDEAYPVKQIYRMLMLTGLRLREAVDASIAEFDFAARDWVIGKERMKGKANRARPHLVPLTPAMLEILGQLPTFEGPFLFSLKCGKAAVTMPQGIKRRIDKRMLEVLREMAVARGDDPDTVTLPHWQNHDIRRSVRTNLSILRDRRGHKFPLEVREAILAHVKPGIVGVYDRHDLSSEKFECLQAWSERLNEIVHGKPSPQVIDFAARRA